MGAKRRSSRTRGVLSVLIAVVITATIAVVVFLRSGFLSARLSDYVNDHYLAGTPFRFSCGRVSGDFVGNVTLARPALRFQHEGRYETLFRAARIRVEYDLMEVFKLRIKISDLDIQDPSVKLVRDPDGRWVLPPIAVATGRAAGTSPQIEIGRFTIGGLDVIVVRDSTESRVEDVDLSGSARYVDRHGELTITGGRAELADFDVPVRRFEMRAVLDEEGLFVQSLEARLERTFVTASGRVVNGELKDCRAVCNPLDLSEVAALGLINPKDGDGEVGGSIHIEGRLDSLGIDGTVAGKAIGLAFSALNFRGAVTPELVYMPHIDGNVFGSQIDGSASYHRVTGDYAFDGTCLNLDITQGFIKDEGVPATNFNGRLTLQHDASAKRYYVTGDLRESSILGFEGDVMEGTVEWRDGVGLAIRSFRLRRPGFRLTARGSVDPTGVGDLIVDLAGDELDYVMDFIALPRIGGRADLSGRVLGPLDRFQVNLNGTWTDLTYLDMRIDSCQITAEGRDVPSLDVAATVDIKGKRINILGRSFATPHILLQADTSNVVVRDFSFSREDTFITSSFIVDPDPERSFVRLNHVAVETPQMAWRNIRATDVVVTPEEVSLDSLELKSNGHLVGVLGTYSLTDGSSDLETWGSAIDLVLVRELFRLPFVLEGVGHYTARISGPTENPNLDVSVDLEAGQVDSIQFDAIHFAGSSDERGYIVREFSIRHGADSLSATGSWGFADLPFEISRVGFDRERALEAPVDLRVKTSGFPVADVLRAIHIDRGVPGAFAGTFEVDNTLGNPGAVLRGTLHAREGDRYRLPATDVDIEYRDERLTVHSLAFDDGKTRARGRGTFPIGVGVGRAIERYDERPVDLEIELFSDDLVRVAGYVDWLARSEGKLALRLRAAGSLGDPALSGTAQLEDVMFRIAGMGELYRDVTATLSLQDSVIRLESVTAMTGKRGKIKGLGVARLAGFRLQSYRVQFDATDVTWYSVEGVVSTQSGTVIVGSRRDPAGALVPDITGRVRVEEARITREILAEENQMAAGAAGAFGPVPLEAPPWYSHLELDAPNNVWVRNRDLNMEIGGQPILIRDENGLSFRGDLVVLRGSYMLYNNKFTVTSGHIDFSAGAVRPDIHISAFTPHRIPGESEHRIFLDYSWPPDKKEPTISLSYDEPGYTETDLWRMLGGQVVAGDAGLGSGSAFSASGAAQNIASNYLERILNAQMQDMVFDVESRIDPNATGGAGQRELSVAVGRYVSPDLFLKYRQGITSATEREVDIEYRISRMVLLRSEIIRNSDRGLAGSSRNVTDEINFDIKLRFEF